MVLCGVRGVICVVSEAFAWCRVVSEVSLLVSTFNNFLSVFIVHR